MARQVQHLEAQAGRLHHVALQHGAVGRRADDRDAEGGAEVQIGAGQQGRLAGADDQRGGGERLFHRLVAGDVVGVPVRVQDRGRRQALVAQEVEDDLRLQAGVDDHGVGAAGQPGHVGVFLEGHGNQRAEGEWRGHGGLSGWGGERGGVSPLMIRRIRGLTPPARRRGRFHWTARPPIAENIVQGRPPRRPPAPAARGLLSFSHPVGLQEDRSTGRIHNPSAGDGGRTHRGPSPEEWQHEATATAVRGFRLVFRRRRLAVRRRDRAATAVRRAGGGPAGRRLPDGRTAPPARRSPEQL